MAKARILGYNKPYIPNRKQKGGFTKMEYDTKEFRETAQGKELVAKYRNARDVGADGPEFETFENFCEWAFSNGYKPGTKLCRGEKRYNADTSYFRAPGEKRAEKVINYTTELKKSIKRWDKTVNAIRRRFGMEPL